AGVTLIEVLAALALLGSLAVAMVLSRARLVEQHQRAEQKLQAVEVANDLQAGWWAEDPNAIPIETSGDIEDNPGWVWETEARKHRELESFAAQVVEVRIVDRSQSAVGVELPSADLVLPQQD
ncbi:unnamed protein product, partial [Ectocarpus fasciculatus]